MVHGRAASPRLHDRREPRRGCPGLPAAASSRTPARIRGLGACPPEPHGADGERRLRDPEDRGRRRLASSRTPRRSAPSAAPDVPRPRRRSSGRWTSSPPRSASTRPRCAGATSSRGRVPVHDARRAPVRLRRLRRRARARARRRRVRGAARRAAATARAGRRRGSSASASACTSRSPPACRRPSSARSRSRPTAGRSSGRARSRTARATRRRSP